MGAELLSASIYAELRRIAAVYLKDERVGHTLQPTALVHEAYLRLCRDVPSAPSRDDFLPIAARAMRRLLINHARDRRALKRGGGARPDALDESLAHVEQESGVDVERLELALERFHGIDPRAARVVELRYFAGCTIAEAAAALGVAHGTVETDWRTARLWLARELSEA